ncbi:YchJ family metal-binding protein [Arcobacteraceae bacterium]|nr:YchJ family metal-binding protein [Arcobacteraceae bacterium]
MRSRYTAYALNNAKYIIKTTHPHNIDFQENKTLWEKEILEFSQNFTFEKLTIHEFIDAEPTSYVTFRAQITSNGNDHTFTEKSSFKKIDNAWVYFQATSII